jgi:hypothetical protein
MERNFAHNTWMMILNWWSDFRKLRQPYNLGAETRHEVSRGGVWEGGCLLAFSPDNFVVEVTHDS